MDVKSILNGDSFRKVEDDFNDITTIVYSRNFHHNFGDSNSYIKMIDNKIYILHTVSSVYGLKLVHLFESVVTKDEFINELKTFNMNQWRFEYPPDPNKGIGLYGEGFYININTSSNRKYVYRGKGEKPETYNKFAKLIGLLFNSVKNLKIFGITTSNYDDWYFNVIDKYIAKQRIKDSNGEAVLRLDRNLNSLDGKIPNIEEYASEWKWYNTYVVEIVDGKPMTINSFNKRAIGFNELFRGDSCRKNKNYELALKYYKSAIEIDDNNQAKFNIAEMIANGEVSLNVHPELEMYVVPPKKTTIEDIINSLKKNKYDEDYETAESYREQGDFENALIYYIKAGERGDATALNNAGVIYMNGLLGKKDYISAIQYLKKAVDVGNIMSIINLGKCYLYGTNEYDKAYEMFSKGINYKEISGEAYNRLGVMHLYGNGVDLDYKKALEYFTISYESGYDDPYYLGLMYLYNYGNLTNDIEKGISLLDKYSKLGDKDSTIELAYYLTKTKDSRASIYIERCKEIGIEDIEERIALKLSGSDVNIYD